MLLLSLELRFCCVLSYGNGANVVVMIQAADFGNGITGKEGCQV